MADDYDYNFSVKVYPIDNPDTFFESYNNGDFQEVQSGETLNTGDTIAVGIYLDVNNGNGTFFDFSLNWDDSILEPLVNSRGNTYISYDDYNYDEYTSWSLPSLKGFDYYVDGKPIVSYKPYKNNFKNADNSMILFWLFFKVKDNTYDERYLTFDFSRTNGYGNYGRTECKITNISSSIKINSKKSLSYTLLGDLNGNGKIDYGDVRMIMAYVARLITFDEKELSVADLNNDGVVDIKDQVAINNLYNGIYN